ncbi:conserved hypothetical protein [Pseudomonas sp. 8Z]|uniref:DUF2971 domain-containing protein n=1 Tax=Pseudomonas sp. 8Z TaxID=2653166 RepID=UPI0012EF0C54|nr:DUF2971 domain-containing protein [Pseudomonas sp. 8Z]VXC95251.1 conserved hypothetical protein [Pseudomonas sp. 8Z]
MILYKYYGRASGLKAIESRKLGFRKPGYFNDPFELTALSNAVGPQVKQETLQARIEALKDQLVILCLTRSPFNPLMWAHYGENHEGFVIGYDVSGPFLNSPEYNLITVDAGDVLYTNTKTPFALNPESMESFLALYQRGFGADDQAVDQALARKLLLTKHACWVYEEEVRVVKQLTNFFTSVEEEQADPLRRYGQITRNLRPEEMPGASFEEGYYVTAANKNTLELYLYEHQVPIREVYLGARNQYREEPGFSELFQAGREVFQMKVNPASWHLEKGCLEAPAR